MGCDHNFFFDMVKAVYDTSLAVVQSIHDQVTGKMEWIGQFHVTNTTKGTIWTSDLLQRRDGVHAIERNSLSEVEEVILFLFFSKLENISKRKAKKLHYGLRVEQAKQDTSHF